MSSKHSFPVIPLQTDGTADSLPASGETGEERDGFNGKLPYSKKELQSLNEALIALNARLHDALERQPVACEQRAQRVVVDLGVGEHIHGVAVFDWRGGLRLL